jgi:predicted phage terminase large subunit-like protein
MDSYAFECLYQQNPQPKEGLLYNKFKTYEKLPNGVVKNITDPADSGECYTCSISYIEFMKQIYVIDILYNQEKDMEKNVAEFLFNNNVSTSEIESNSMGRLFKENVKRYLSTVFKSNRTTCIGYTQHDNKDAKIFASASWVSENVYMPENWGVKHYHFHSHITNYPASGKTKYKDGADVLAEIFKRINKPNKTVRQN